MNPCELDQRAEKENKPCAAEVYGAIGSGCMTISHCQFAAFRRYMRLVNHASAENADSNLLK